LAKPTHTDRIKVTRMSAPRPTEAPRVDLRIRAAKFMSWYTSALLVFSLVYWVWAIYNVIHAVFRGVILSFQHFDYGVVSFFGVILSCIFFRIYTIPTLQGLHEHDEIPVSTKYWFSAPQLLVSLNYLQCYTALYCATFSIGWLVLSTVSFCGVDKCIAISKKPESRETYYPTEAEGGEQVSSINAVMESHC
jgi:hypothetical protein